MNSRYITRFPGKLLVVDYLRLKSDLIPELSRILKFLGKKTVVDETSQETVELVQATFRGKSRHRNEL